MITAQFSLKILNLTLFPRELFFEFERLRIFWRVLLSHARAQSMIVCPEINRYGLSDIGLFVVNPVTGRWFGQWTLI
jgi:hypothetical protein